MTRSEFTAEFAAVLGVPPESLDADTELATIEAWDSVAYLSTMLLIDEKLGMTIRPEALSGAVTLGDMLAVVAPALEA